MAKFKAPENCNSVSVGGQEFQVAADGTITVPDAGDYAQLLIPHGFEPLPPEPDTEEQKAAKLAEVAANDKAAAEALAKEQAEAAAAAEAAEAEKQASKKK